jgi:hypothetical protein
MSDIGDAENISKSHVSRILRLTLLAPDIVEAILAGTTGQGVMLGQLEGAPASWEEQRTTFLARRLPSLATGSQRTNRLSRAPAKDDPRQMEQGD